MYKENREEIKKASVVVGVAFMIIFALAVVFITWKVSYEIFKDRFYNNVTIECLDSGNYTYGDDLQYIIKVDGNVDKINISGDEEIYDVSQLNENEILITIRTGKIDKEQFPYTISIDYKHTTCKIVIQ